MLPIRFNIRMQVGLKNGKNIYYANMKQKKPGGVILILGKVDCRAKNITWVIL